MSEELEERTSCAGSLPPQGEVRFLKILDIRDQAHLALSSEGEPIGVRVDLRKQPRAVVCNGSAMIESEGQERLNGVFIAHPQLRWAISLS
jgi:hypothetical protein